MTNKGHDAMKDQVRWFSASPENQPQLSCLVTRSLGAAHSLPSVRWSRTGEHRVECRYFPRTRLPHSGLHVPRHTAAKLRRDAGGSIEKVSRFLDHGSLAVTTAYLRRLNGQEDLAYGRVAEAIGV